MKKRLPIIVAVIITSMITSLATYRFAQHEVPSEVDQNYHEGIRQAFEFASGDVFRLERISLSLMSDRSPSFWAINGYSDNPDLDLRIDLLHQDGYSILKKRAADRRTPTQDRTRYKYETTVAYWSRSPFLTARVTLHSTGEIISKMIPNPILYHKLYDAKYNKAGTGTLGRLRKVPLASAGDLRGKSAILEMVIFYLSHTKFLEVTGYNYDSEELWHQYESRGDTAKVLLDQIEAGGIRTLAHRSIRVDENERELELIQKLVYKRNRDNKWILPKKHPAIHLAKLTARYSLAGFENDGAPLIDMRMLYSIQDLRESGSSAMEGGSVSRSPWVFRPTKSGSWAKIKWVGRNKYAGIYYLLRSRPSKKKREDLSRVN